MIAIAVMNDVVLVVRTGQSIGRLAITRRRGRSQRVPVRSVLAADVKEGCS
jgi:hypothetical protein